MKGTSPWYFLSTIHNPLLETISKEMIPKPFQRPTVATYNPNKTLKTPSDAL
jgi:hypothetical protein